MKRYTNVILACVAMLAAAVLAEVLTPHRLMARSYNAFTLEDNIPFTVGDWGRLKGVEAVRPPPNEMEQEIYSQEVSRVFVDPQGHVLMLLIAYGESQSERLQMHHPEVCYAAQGFRVTPPTTSKFLWSQDEPPIQVTRLLASRENRLEPISYWMRVGYDNTTSNWERQALKLGYGLRGLIPDGALIRVSTVGVAPELAYKMQDQFIRDLLKSLNPATRTFLIGEPAKAILRS